MTRLEIAYEELVRTVGCPERRAQSESYALAYPYQTSRITRYATHVVTFRLAVGDIAGFGECVPYERYGESSEQTIRDLLREEVPKRGAARDAFCAALLDLSCKLEKTSVLALLRRFLPELSIGPALPISTMLSIGAGELQDAKLLESLAIGASALKFKVRGRDSLDKLAAIRRQTNLPFLVDPNESWTVETYLDLVPHLEKLGVVAIEQPFPSTDDAMLARLPRPIPVFADESIHTSADLPAIAERYDGVNLKLGKAGGLLDALPLRAEAEALDLQVMIGCMVCTSLSIQPALYLAQGLSYVDLDGPLLLSADRSQVFGEPFIADSRGATLFPSRSWGGA